MRSTLLSLAAAWAASAAPPSQLDVRQEPAEAQPAPLAAATPAVGQIQPAGNPAAVNAPPPFIGMSVILLWT